MLNNPAEKRTASLYTVFYLHKSFRVTKFVCLCKRNSSQVPSSILTDQNDNALTSLSTPPKFPRILKNTYEHFKANSSILGDKSCHKCQIRLNFDEVNQWSTAHPTLIFSYSVPPTYLLPKKFGYRNDSKTTYYKTGKAIMANSNTRDSICRAGSVT